MTKPVEGAPKEHRILAPALYRNLEILAVRDCNLHSCAGQFAFKPAFPQPITEGKTGPAQKSKKPPTEPTEERTILSSDGRVP